MNTKNILYGISSILFIINIAMSEPNHSGWPLKVLSWDIDKAYPGIEYNYRLAVRGGEYPYKFKLTQSPADMKIDSLGIITWTPVDASSNNIVTTVITDSKGDSLIHSFTVDATTNKFYFVDSANGHDTTNTGSESSPWATMTYACTHADSISYVYVKKGTYNETFGIAHNYCGRFLAYPGDLVTVIGTGTGNYDFAINGGNKRIFQGFTFDANDHNWLFSIGGAGYVQNVIWRKNIMHNVSSTGENNPAFIFFWNGSGNPVTDQNGNKNIVIQENIFYDLKNNAHHGASVTMYDVQNLIYENNVAYDINSRGINDKDMGYMNTYRNNVIHDCQKGICLESQGGEAGEEICYNHIYNCTTSVYLGSQPGYLNNVFLHHNTISCVNFGAASCIYFSWLIDSSLCTNINIYKNILGNGTNAPYRVCPKGSTYPAYINAMDSKKVQIDSNLICPPSSDAIICAEWGPSCIGWLDWRNQGFDRNSILMQFTVDTNNNPNLPDSLKKNYGSNVTLADNTTKSTTQDTTDLTSPLSILPNPFSPDKSVSEFTFLAQKLGTNAPKGTRISFTPQTSSATIKLVKIGIFNVVGEQLAKITMQNATKMTEYHLWWDGRTTKRSGLSWEELKTIGSDANGREMSGDKMCRNGRYFVALTVKDSEGKTQKYMKQVVLIK